MWRAEAVGIHCETSGINQSLGHTHHCAPNCMLTWIVRPPFSVSEHVTQGLHEKQQRSLTEGGIVSRDLPERSVRPGRQDSWWENPALLCSGDNMPLHAYFVEPLPGTQFPHPQYFLVHHTMVTNWAHVWGYHALSWKH